MRKIEDNDWLYSMVQRYAEWHFVHTYRRIEFVGRENIPADGVTIYAPNHVNGLMDPVAMICCNHRPKVFAARADMFRLRWLVPLLRRAKIMPVNRIRDGWEQVKENGAVINNAAEVLEAGADFSIMPEATHRPKHSLLPLGKGIFRIACRADEVLQGKKNVYILPVGLEYGSFYRYRSTLLVNIGKPIDVTTFVREHLDLSMPQVYNLLSEELSQRLRALIAWLPDDKRYDALLEAGYLFRHLPASLGENGSEQTLLGKMKQKQRITQRILQQEAVQPEATARLYAELNEIVAERRRLGIVASSLTEPLDTLFGRIWKRGIGLFFTFPYFAFAALCTAPMWLLLLLVFSFEDDKAFINSLRYGFVMFFLPVVYLVEILLCAACTPWWLLVLFCALLLPAHWVFYEYLRQGQRWISDLRLRKAGGLRMKIANLGGKDFDCD